MGITGFNRARRAIAIAKKRAQAEEKPEVKVEPVKEEPKIEVKPEVTETKVDSETEKPAVKKASKK